MRRREGTRVIQRHEAHRAMLDAAIAQGLADVNAGRVKSIDEVIDRLDAKYRALAADRAR